MIKEIRINDVRKIYPKRDPSSHKGLNGKVMIVGGSLEYFGAPILSALGALYGGADLVYLFVPDSNFDVTRSIYPDFIVKTFQGDSLNMKSISQIVEFSKKCDVVLIGPGLSEDESTLEVILKIVKELEIPTVLDAGAIQVFQQIKTVPKQQIVLTPHHNEFETLTGKDIKIKGSLSHKVVLLRTLATDLKINILLKGPQDLIASEDGEITANSTGNAGMTVGGSGDVLSGLVSALIAQGASPYNSCQVGAFVCGKAGEELFKTKGYCFSASDLALEIPYVLRHFSV